MYLNKFAHYKKRDIENILIKLSGSKMSSGNYDSTKVGFFSQDSKRVPFEIGNKSLPRMPDELNRNIQLIYKLIGDPDKEVYLEEWTILSLNQVLERFSELQLKNQDRVFDIAIRYAGMGHIDVLSCDLQTHKLFIRNDGGANGWEREFHYRELLTLDPSIKPQMYFQEWFYTSS